MNVNDKGASRGTKARNRADFGDGGDGEGSARAHEAHTARDKQISCSISARARAQQNRSFNGTR